MDKSEVKGSEDLNSSEENIGKNKSKIRAKKRKRIESDTSSDGDDVLPDNTLDVERSVHASAIKNNLDETSVKKILKKVVTNDHVLALVKLREEEEDSGTEAVVQPVTRAKAKKNKSHGYPPWDNIQLTPIKHIPVKTRPEVKALIAQEMPDDEDDEEYEPTPDDVMSDDDHIIEPCSDLKSPSKSPSKLRKNNSDTSKVQDGPSEVAQEVSEVQKKPDSEIEEATIALRTRSKLCLSETPIEHIEGVFEPPEDVENDDIWSDFLNECLNPASNARNEDDDETDPEYSVAADPDANEEDEEALENSIIKISKKELSDLVTELFNVMPQGTDELDDIQQVLGESNNTEVTTVWEGKQEPQSDEESKGRNAAKVSDRRDSTRYSIGKTEPPDYNEYEPALVIDTSANCEMTNEQSYSEPNESEASKNAEVRPGSTALSALIERNAQKASQSDDRVDVSAARAPPAAPPAPPPARPPPILRKRLTAQPVTVVNIVIDQPFEMYPQQIQILQQQLRQHVQLAASNFLQLFVHPLHWSYAPKYKEYLVSLNKMIVNNPNSVVNVCNLRPAIELVESWESALSHDSPESIAMIQFTEKELEKCRLRTAQNNPYFGDFPEIFKNVVANSSVFLYPYLLPPVPYKSDYTHRRFNYLRSEDQLIVLGLDQFWRYVEDNPQLYPRPARLHSRHRWGLSTVARLVSAHLLPCITPRSLLAHLHLARKGGAKDSVIVQYLKYNKIEPVKHKLLPFNPKITLYEQPEFEMPRLWIKYLAKNSKRFRDFIYRRKTQPPAGVEVGLDRIVETVERPPLPIDFTKTISCNRINMLPLKPTSELVDKVDVHIQKIDQNATPITTVLLASNIYTLINTSKGAQLIPLQAETSTVNSTTTPILTPAIVNSVTTQKIINPDAVDGTNDAETTEVSEERTSKSNDAEVQEKDDGHCKCCKLIKKIRRKRQTIITEYFNTNKKKNNKICDCRGRKYPRITNKLRLLVNNYKTLSKIVFNEVVAKLDKYKNGKNCDLGNYVTQDSEIKDLVAAVMFQIKLVERWNKIRNLSVKLNTPRVFAKFDVENDDPLELAERLFNVFDVDLAEMYKEFLGFLTAQQADQINSFKDYFVRNCVQELIAKIEEHVLENKKRGTILKCIKGIILDNKAQACEICCKLLDCAKDYPELAQYIFSLFPHRWREEADASSDLSLSKKDIEPKESNLKTSIEAETVAAAEYEADNSSSDDDDDEAVENGNDVTNNELQPAHIQQEKQEKLTTRIKYEEPDESEMTIDETVDRSDLSDDSMSRLIMSEDESFKVEVPDWNREEDKLILEVLKNCISPEEMNNKTLIDVIENKNIVNMIADSLSHKSIDEVRERMLYLLEILVNNIP